MRQSFCRDDFEIGAYARWQSEDFSPAAEFC
jgi:hypothetical protein